MLSVVIYCFMMSKISKIPKLPKMSVKSFSVITYSLSVLYGVGCSEPNNRTDCVVFVVF